MYSEYQYAKNLQVGKLWKIILTENEFFNCGTQVLNLIDLVVGLHGSAACSYSFISRPYTKRIRSDMNTGSSYEH